MAKFILSIDQGTTGSQVTIMSEEGQALYNAKKEFKQHYPKPGWVEHDPEDIWKSVTDSISEALEKSQISVHDIAAIGITNQRETTVIWDRQTGRPVYNAIVWQCRRTSDFCDKIRKKYSKTIKQKTGLVIDPYFSASKVRWILENDKNLRRRAENGELAFGTIDTFLLWRLTHGEVHATDVTNASRTQLMNIKTANWDKELLKIFNVPESLLPELKPSSGVFGQTKKCHVLPDGIPISGIAGDQQAALFGQACFSPGEAKCTYGTGSFLLMNTGSQMLSSKAGLLTTVAWQLRGERKLTYALEGSVFVCGAAVQWLRDGLKFIKNSNEIEDLANSVPDAGGVEFVPALTGMGAPYWDPHARGLICGLTRGTTPAHIARATLEAIALQNAELLLAMEKDLKKKLKTLKVDGGACRNNLLMQIQSDYLNVPIFRPKMIETTSLGAAYLAGLGVGLWKSTDDIKKIWKVDQNFKPQMVDKDRKARFHSWKTAINRTLS